MKLHFFNPEHDIALAANLSNFTAPHAGRQLRHDLGWLPALWADSDDCVLVDDVELALAAWHRFIKHNRLFPHWQGSFVTRSKEGVDFVCPWGWDLAMRARLLHLGVDAQKLPTEEQIAHIRRLSHRCYSRELLSFLRLEDTVGESFVCDNETQLSELLAKYGRLVLKAPWSSSGRGLRFIDASRNTLVSQAGWIKNVLTSQGCVMAEPYYNKVRDFGMEFLAHADGRVTYEGLSLFQTKNGAYTGNLLATERAKAEMMARYLLPALLEEVAQLICHHTSRLFDAHYAGPFGVDMMVVGGDSGFLLHPCVEVNLRNTMGHVALLLGKLVNPTQDDDVKGVMRIELNERYQLKTDKFLSWQ